MKFKGLCIGGPAEGQIVVSNCRTYAAIEYLNPRAVWAYALEESVTYKLHQYRYEPVRCNDNSGRGFSEIGFWVHEDLPKGGLSYLVRLQEQFSELSKRVKHLEGNL